VNPVSLALIRKVADLAPETDIPLTSNSVPGADELRAALEDAGVPIRKEKMVGDSYALEVDCPFYKSHTGKAIVGVQPDGRLYFKCQAEKCGEKRFSDFAEAWGLRLTGPNDQTKKLPGGWTEPQKFFDFDLPLFPTGALPGWVESMVVRLATQLQTPVDIPAIFALACLSVALQKLFRIRLREGWEEPLNLYVLGISPSATRKSAVVNALAGPIYDHQRKERERLNIELVEAASEGKALARKLKAVEEEAASTSGKEADRLLDEAKKITKRLAELSEKRDCRLIADDVTPEQLGVLMARNGGTLSILSSEGDFLEILMGRYAGDGKRSNNVGLILKGHCGDPFSQDRINRDSVEIARPLLTLGLAIQPFVLQGLISAEDMRGKGLLARFLFVMPTSNIGFRDCDPPAVPGEVKEIYRKGINALLHQDPPEEGEGDSHVLELSPEASDLFLRFQVEIEEKLRGHAEFGAIPDWGGKFVGHVGRIAGLIHIARHPFNPHRHVSADTVRRAIEIGEHLAIHALATFQLLGFDPKEAAAKKLLNWIIQAEVQSFSKRDAHKANESYFKEAKHLDVPLDVLISRNFIREIATEQGKKAKGGRPKSRCYEVNPLVHEARKRPRESNQIVYFECIREEKG